jgi:WD40 repeat protein
VACFPAHSKRIDGLVCDSARLWHSCSRDSSVKAFDQRTGKAVRTLATDSRKEMYCLACWDSLVAAGQEDRLVLWDVRKSSKPLLYEEEAHQDDITTVAFGIEGVLMSGGMDCLVTNYDTKNLAEFVTSTYRDSQPILNLQVLDSQHIILTSTAQSLSIVNARECLQLR